jgi:hypothetical protein
VGAEGQVVDRQSFYWTLALDVRNRRGSRLDWHMKRNIARHRTAASLYRLAFDDVVSDLLKVTAAAVAETTPRPVARPIRPRTSPQPRSRRATSRPARGGKS